MKFSSLLPGFVLRISQKKTSQSALYDWNLVHHSSVSAAFWIRQSVVCSSPASISPCFLLSSWERYHVPSMLKMLYYSFLGNVHFFCLRETFSIAYCLFQEVLLIGLFSFLWVIYSSKGSPPTPSVSAALHFELHEFFVHILVGDVCRPLSYSLIFFSPWYLRSFSAHLNGRVATLLTILFTFIWFFIPFNTMRSLL